MRSGELWKAGRRVALQEQPFRVLVKLLERPGELVTRDELRRQLWPADTFVDFDHGLNAAIRRLREVLGDSWDAARFVETLPRRGYRFIAPVTWLPPNAAPSRAPDTARSRRGVALLAILLMASAAVIAALTGLGRWRSPATSRGAAPVPAIRSLGVLPLRDLSGDPSQRYFADGMHEALTSELSRISAVRTVSRTSMLRYAGSTQPVPEIAKALNVDALLEGSVLQVDGRVRVNVQLVSGTTDQRLWGDSYEQPIEDVLSLQMQIARDVVRQIRVIVTPEETLRWSRQRRVNPDAYRFHLQGNYQMARQSPEAYEKAQAFFQEAVARDPEYAPPHAALALVFILLDGWDGFAAPVTVHSAAVAAAQRALALDPTLADAHMALGVIRHRFDWDWAAADTSFTKGMAFGANSSFARVLYANFLTSMGRIHEAISVGSATLEQDPLLPIAHQELALAYMTGGQLERGIELCGEALALDPDLRSARVLRALAYLKTGKSADAVAEVNALRTLVGDDGSPYRIGQLGYLYARTGQRAEARRTLEVLHEREARGGYVPASAYANVYVGLDRRAEALREFHRAFAQHDVWLIWLKTHLMYDDIRADPRFQDLIEAMKFPDGRAPAPAGPG